MYLSHRHSAKLGTKIQLSTEFALYNKKYSTTYSELVLLVLTIQLFFWEFAPLVREQIQLKTHLGKVGFFNLAQFSEKAHWRAAQTAIPALGQGLSGGQGICFWWQCQLLLASGVFSMTAWVRNTIVTSQARLALRQSHDISFLSSATHSPFFATGFLLASLWACLGSERDREDYIFPSDFIFQVRLLNWLVRRSMWALWAAVWESNAKLWAGLQHLTCIDLNYFGSKTVLWQSKLT